MGDGDNFHPLPHARRRLAGVGMGAEDTHGQEGPQGSDGKRGRLPAFSCILGTLTTRAQRRSPVRMAGIDAPEGAHFGRPAQPYASEALAFLQSYILGRRVRAYIYKRDQYDRVVGTVWVRRFLFFRKDVGLEMLKRGLATTYEAKSGGRVRRRGGQVPRRRGQGEGAAQGHVGGSAGHAREPERIQDADGPRGERV